jgi:hypothetical protein
MSTLGNMSEMSGFIRIFGLRQGFMKEQNQHSMQRLAPGLFDTTSILMN